MSAGGGGGGAAAAAARLTCLRCFCEVCGKVVIFCDKVCETFL